MTSKSRSTVTLGTPPGRQPRVAWRAAGDSAGTREPALREEPAAPTAGSVASVGGKKKRGCGIADPRVRQKKERGPGGPRAAQRHLALRSCGGACGVAVTSYRRSEPRAA